MATALAMSVEDPKAVVTVPPVPKVVSRAPAEV
jgi:hypothetical protein